MLNKIIELKNDNDNESIEKEVMEFGVCSCCGGDITFTIYENVLIKWHCQNPQPSNMCIHYGIDIDACNLSDCRLNNESIIEERKKFREIIKKKFLEIMNKEGEVMFVHSGEIIHSIMELRLDKTEDYLYQRLPALDSKDEEVSKIIRRG